MSGSLSSGAHSRDPLAHPGYAAPSPLAFLFLDPDAADFTFAVFNRWLFHRSSLLPSVAEARG
jgi:hypothetical protein